MSLYLGLSVDNFGVSMPFSADVSGSGDKSRLHRKSKNHIACSKSLGTKQGKETPFIARIGDVRPISKCRRGGKVLSPAAETCLMIQSNIPHRRNSNQNILPSLNT